MTSHDPRDPRDPRRGEMPHDARPDSWDPEHVAEVVGRELMRDPDAPLWRDERFLEWLAHEERARRARERHSDEEVLALGRELLVRARARQLGTQWVAGRPPERRAPIPATPAMVLEDAAEEGAAPIVDLAVAAGSGRELWDEVAEWWMDLPPNLPVGRYIPLRITGDSMRPIMHTGDTVLVRIGPVVRPETVVVARGPDDGYVCKAVRRVRGATIELGSLDPSYPPMTIPRDGRLIVGTVLMLWCHHHPPRR